MINQVVANPDYTSTSNQYGFYALPKTLKPKTKYRQDNNSQYEDEQQSNVEENPIVPLEDQPEDEKKLQRDYFVDEAPWPEFKPKEPGHDIGIQVQDAELFDFELQVEPLLQVLIGQSILKARNQLQEQKQNSQNKKKLSQFEKKRNAELMVTQRLQNQHKRKHEEAERRKLQHTVQKQQKKLTLKKIISFTEAKRALAGLRNEVLGDLQDQGLLRHDMFITLRTTFEPWLYEQIVSNLKVNKQIEVESENLLSEKQKQIKNNHKKHIDKQNERRKQILDQREKERLENQERKRKKQIKKQRLALNKVRIDKFTKLQEIISKTEKIDQIIKADISDNTSKPRNVVYISGGFFLHLLEIFELLTTLKIELTTQLIEQLILKILTEKGTPLQITLSPSVRQRIVSIQNQMRDQFVNFYNRKSQIIEQLLADQNIFNSEFLRIFGLKLNKSIVREVLNSIFDIYFTINPPEEAPIQQGGEVQQQQPKIVLSDLEKKKLSLRGNIVFNYEQKKLLESVTQVVRLRYPLQHAQESQNAEQQAYIQVFDGQGWQYRKTKHPQKITDRQPVLINLSGFQHAFVYDEVSQNLLNQWILSQLNNIGANINRNDFITGMKRKAKIYEQFSKKEVPIYDCEFIDETP